MKKKKIFRKAMAVLLSFVMLVTCFTVAIPMVKAQGETINGISQTRIVPDGTYQSVYASYAAAYLNGYGEPTELVIPGLSETNNYVVQGITYYPEKDWVLITAYHNSDSPSPSMVYCIDVKTGDFVAMFSFINVDGTANTDHGGGIAISENNIYYSCGDTDRSIAYAPLSAIEGIENDATKYRTVQLIAEQTFYETGSVADGDATAYTAYCCYDQGVLWTGNFYDEGIAGLVAADYDVKAHNDYPSMVWGYELSGAGPEEEWANLTSGAVGSQGNPSYVVALPSDIKDVQYATVDDGRLYLSRSYGTGTETCQNFGMSAYSQLSIADIDLTVGGSGTITFTTDANGTQRTVNNAYIVPSVQTFDFMPMSEGLCVIDDYIYMTFESATYKYYEDAGIMGNCDMPVDVVWKIDQYGLLGHERPDENDVTAYQKVNDISEISATDEYIIVYESELKAEGNQNNILYALNSYGGYQGDRLPKTDAGTATNTMDSMGMIGHKITDYHTYTNENGDDYLILGNAAAADDVTNIRWNLIGAGTGAMRFHSVDLYNAEYSYLYFDQRLIYMSTEANSNLNNIVLMNKTVDGVTYPGEFWIYNSANSSYLWCNDGSDESIMNAYNSYYQTGNSTDKYYGETEVAGTFHADARKTASGSATGNQATALSSPYKLGTFNIYKRITTDPHAIGGTGLETDLKAVLQADGTYTINLGTYATSEAHKYLGESGYPTDFMFVLDASGSMTNNSDYVTFENQGNLAISRGMANDSTGYYVFVDKVTKTDGSIVEVNEFCRLEGHYKWGLFNSTYWVGAVSQTNSDLEYMINTDGKFYWSKDQISTVSGSDTTITQALPVYRKATTTRLQGMKDTVNSFISKIDANAQTYNIEHRVGITTFGSNADESYLNTGIYSTLSGTALNSYSTDLSKHYAAAFYPSNHSNLKTIVNNINTSSGDPDTFANYGMEMAVNAYAQQSPAYGGAGDRYYSDFTDSEGILHEKNANAVVIFLTDGCPGLGGSDSATATTVANEAIPSAQAIKGAGGTIYSVQVSDATMDGFDMASYMNGVSSNYPSATSLTSLGSQASSDYYVKAATDGTVDVNVVLNEVFEHIEDNYIDVGTSITLDGDSIVRHALGKHFKLTDSSKVSLSTSSITEDVLGNISFGNNKSAGSSVTYSVDTTSNTVQVTGFDYSSNYYAKNAKEGERLNIVIDNVLPVDTDEISMDISNQTYTAIYEDATNMSNNRKFKGYPNVAFEIPEYTYVLDYAMPMLDTDINGTVVSVDSELRKQNTSNYNESRESDNIALTLQDNGLNMTYELLSGKYTEADNRSYCLIQRDDGTYDWFRINIVPASNVLYEEDRFTASSVGSLTKSNWKTDGSVISTYQSLSGNADRYGYDSAYENNGAGYSNGTALKATVNSSTKRSETMTFSYKGTGFDLMAVCGANTGVQLVNIKNSDGTIEKVYIVDTYYVDTDNYSGALFKQVPIVNHTNAGGYGEYTVEVTAAYLSNAQGVTGSRAGLFNKSYSAQDLLKDMGISPSDVEYVWFNNNSVLNGGTGPVADASASNRATTASNVELNCYIDGIRVYNPLGDDSSLYIDSEKGAKYYNIVNELASGTGDVITSGSGLFAYVVGELDADEEGNVPTLSFGNYQSVGPQNEIYLQSATGADNSHAVAFNVALPNSDSRVMISLRAVDGSTKAKVASGGNAIEFEINTATEQYYDITPYLDVDTSTGVANVIVTNSGSGLLSVNNIKLVDATAQAITAEDFPVMARSFSLSARTVEPNSYDYDAIVGDDTQQPSVDEPVDDNTDDIIDVEVPAIVGNIFTRIIAFFKNLLDSIFNFF